MRALAEAVAGRIEERCGLRFTNERRADLSLGLEALARTCGLPDADAAACWLLAEPAGPAFSQAVGLHFTVGETYFFRERALFARLRDTVLPALVSARAGARRLNIWSAGCSSGEEAWSLAITAGEALGTRTGWKLDVLGTDIDPAALTRARAAVYGAWSFRECPEATRAAHFVARGGGRFAPVPALRERVRFEFLNLVADPYPAPPGGFDLILCRNVLMYFAPEPQARVLARLGAALADDGWLIVGATEMPAEPPSGLTGVTLDGVLALRRVTGGQEIAVPAPAPRAPPRRRAARGSTGPAVRRVRKAAAAERPAAAAATQPAADLFETARRCADAGMWAEARELCERALADDRLNTRWYLLYALVLDEQGEPDKAREWLQRTVYLEPGCVMAHVALGDLAARAHEPDASRRHFRNALAALAERPAAEPVADQDGLTVAALRGWLHEVVGEHAR